MHLFLSTKLLYTYRDLLKIVIVLYTTESIKATTKLLELTMLCICYVEK